MAGVGNYDRNSIIASMKARLDVLAAVCSPEVCFLLFPAIFNSIFESLTKALSSNGKSDKFAVGLPRGHGKTIVMKLMLVWSILFSDRKFIAVVCASSDLAENLVADVWSILQHPNIKSLFGDLHILKDTAKFKKFEYRGRTIMIRAQGAGTKVRGLNVEMVRPDLFLIDDLQDKEVAKSEELSKALQEWFTGTLMKAKAPERCTFIYLGNMYPDVKIKGSVERFTCILRNLQINSRWKSWVVGAILSDGNPIWPELRSKEDLYEELAEDMSMGQEATFFAEVMNDPNAQSNPVWNAAKVKAPYSEIVGHEGALGRFIILDPSLGKKKSDEQIGMLVEFWDNIPEIVEIRKFQCSAPDTVKGLVAWMVEKRVPLLCAESVAYQSTVIEWFDFMCELIGVEGLTAVPVFPKGRQKNSRIISAMKGVMSGNLSVAYAPRVAMWLQAQQFEPTKTNNKDDIWDCAGYIDDVMMEYGSEATIIDGEFEVVSDRPRIGQDNHDYNGTDENDMLVDFSDCTIDYQ